MKKLLIVLAVLLLITSCDYFLESDAISIPSWAIGEYILKNQNDFTSGCKIEITHNNIVYEWNMPGGDYKYFNLADYMSDPDVFIKDQNTSSSWYEAYYLDIYDYTNGYEKIGRIILNGWPEDQGYGDLTIEIDNIGERFYYHCLKIQ